jgi:hypothetical protein
LRRVRKEWTATLSILPLAKKPLPKLRLQSARSRERDVDYIKDKKRIPIRWKIP